jgi:hypothetical protein
MNDPGKKKRLWLIAALIIGVLLLGLILWDWRPFAFRDLQDFQSTNCIRIVGYVPDQHSIKGKLKHVTITGPSTVSRVLATLDIERAMTTRDRLSSPYATKVTLLHGDEIITELTLADYSDGGRILEEHTSIGDLHPPLWRQIQLSSSRFPELIAAVLAESSDLDQPK